MTMSYLTMRNGTIAGVCCLFFFAVQPVGATSDADFEKLYYYYYPRHGKYVNSTYRHSFDKALFGKAPSPEWKPRDRELYYAFHGDPRAFHGFVRSHEGEDTDWDYQTVLLLVKLGDDRFSQLLAHEDRSTCEAVSVAIDTRIDWSKHNFPKTRGLYSYRYKRPNRSGP